jgi:hypothetical protein
MALVVVDDAWVERCEHSGVTACPPSRVEWLHGHTPEPDGPPIVRPFLLSTSTATASTETRQPLRLILDHRNGVNSDNSTCNLRLLCPNCDSQNSATRGGANRGRVRKSEGGFCLADRDYHLPAELGVYRRFSGI